DASRDVKKIELVFFELVFELPQHCKGIAALWFWLVDISTCRQFWRTVLMPGNIGQGENQFIFNLLEDIEVTGTQHCLVSAISFVVGNGLIGIELSFRTDQMQHDFRIYGPFEWLEAALADYNGRGVNAKPEQKLAKRTGFTLQLPTRDPLLLGQIGNEPF